MARATRAKCEPAWRRTTIATASLCSVFERYTMMRLRSLPAAATAHILRASHAPCGHQFLVSAWRVRLSLIHI
eukprot:6596919-Lingulodinium_polyedra.AAC.1